MIDAPDYDVYTLELGPFDSLAELHADLSNHTGTFANMVCSSDQQEVVSISHSVLHIGGQFYVSALTTTTGRH